MKKDKDRVVLRRGRTEHAWNKSSGVPRPIESANSPSSRLRLPRASLSRWMPLIVGGTLAASAIGLIVALSFRSF